MFKSGIKYFSILSAMVIVMGLYNNCSPSFQTGNMDLDQNSSTLGQAQADINSSVMLDKSRFRSLINTNTNEIDLQCLDYESETNVKYPSLLTKEEITNGLKDVLGIEIDTTGYPTLLKIDGFEESNKFSTTSMIQQSIESIASRTATAFTESLLNGSNNKWSCADADNCLELVSNDVIKYLWRRPVNTDERNLISQVAANYSVKEAKIYQVLNFALSAPQLFIRNVTSKNAVNGELVSLYTQAESMAFILGSTFTPKDLFDQIEDQTIQSHDEIFEYAKRYIEKEENLHRAVDNFFGVWLDFKTYLDRDLDFDGRKVSELAQHQKQRIYNLVRDDQPLELIIKDGGEGYVDSKLFAYQTFNSADDSWPIYRGLRVLGDLMCFDLATNELNAATEEKINEVLNSKDFPTDGNNMEKMAYHRNDAACYSCHQFIDPAAIGLEVFDAFGNLRDEYPNGDPIDFDNTEFAGQKYSNYEEYASILKETFDFKHCFTEKIHHKIRSIASTAKTNSCFMTQLFQGPSEPGLATLLLNTLKTDLVRRENRPNY